MDGDAMPVAREWPLTKESAASQKKPKWKMEHHHNWACPGATGLSEPGSARAAIGPLAWGGRAVAGTVGGLCGADLFPGNAEGGPGP